MKSHDIKKTVIETIQQNLKQMQLQAQHYIDKNHNHLPSICTARHYLFKTIQNNNLNGKINETGLSLTEGKYIKKQNGKINKSQSEGKQQKQKSLGIFKFKPRTSIYNLQFAKKDKMPDSEGYTNNRRNIFMNSTSLKMKMNGNWKNYRQKVNLSSRTSLQQHNCPTKQKLRTIVMNSQIIDLAQKDLKLINTLSPKRSSSKLQLLKKPVQFLQRYANHYHEYKSCQLQLSSTLQNSKIAAIAAIANKSNKILQNSIPKQLLLQNQQHCSARRKRILRISFDHHDSIKKQKLQKQLLAVSNLSNRSVRLTKLQQNKKNSYSKQLNRLDEDYTPWGYGDKFQQVNSYDF